MVESTLSNMAGHLNLAACKSSNKVITIHRLVYNYNQNVQNHVKTLSDYQKLVFYFLLFSSIFLVIKWRKEVNLESRDSCFSTAITDNSIEVQCIEMPHLLPLLSTLPNQSQDNIILHCIAFAWYTITCHPIKIELLLKS